MTTNIAFFDFDGTITFSDSFTPFIYRSVDEKTLRRGKLRLLPYILANKMGALSGSVLRKKVVRIALAGKSEAELKNAGLFYSKTEIPALLREDAMKKIRWHKSQGDTVVVVSASLDLYLNPGASRMVWNSYAVRWHFQVEKQPENTKRVIAAPA